MKRRTRKAVILVVCTVVIAALPVAGSLYYTHEQALDASQKHLDDVAVRAAQRAWTVLLTVEAALADSVFPARNGCNEALIRHFRDRTFSLPTVQGLGYVTDDGRLACTSYGIVDPPRPVRLEPTIQPDGSIVRFLPPAETAFAPGPTIIALHRLRDGSWLGAAFAPESLTNGFEPASLGDHGYLRVVLAGVPMATIGEPHPSAPDFLDARADVGVYQAEVLVGAGRAWALAPWRRNALVTAGVGAAAGLALAFGAAHLGRKRLSLSAELSEGLENREFEVWYQPIIDLQQDRCRGAEALIRWRHPERDLVPPDLFIALAEESGVIIPMTRWLMREVGRQMGPLLATDPSLHIGVNLAPAHVASLDIVEDARRIASEFGIRPHQILFELTERGLIDQPECREVIEELSRLGTELAIDDFGTGYSSLAYIEKFKLDYLKIDKVFVAAIGHAAPLAKLTQVVIDMAKSLGLKTIAEGVETEAQARYLRDQGVNYAQGYVFSRPLVADDFRVFVRSDREFGLAGAVAQQHLALGAAPDVA